MASLEKKKVSFKRHTNYRTVLSQVGVAAIRSSGQVSLIINNDPEDGSDRYILHLNQEDLKKIMWAFQVDQHID